MTRLGAVELAAMPRLAAVCTLSSGEDHLDHAALTARRLVVRTGRGGNARAVADWVAWAIAEPLGDASLAGRRAVVVGLGAVGTLVAADLRARGAEVVLVDPPRARHGDPLPFVALDAALATRPDLITLHVPRIRAGEDRTLDLLDAERLDRLRGAVVVNAARGGVVDEHAAANLRRRGHLAWLALDVFAGEPRPDPAVVAAADRASAHIGGHSVEGKLRVALLAVRAMWRDLATERGAAMPAAIVDEEHALATAVAESVHAGCQTAGLSVEALAPEIALDRADAALRAALSAGADFLAVRSAHLRLESGSTMLAGRGGANSLHSPVDAPHASPTWWEKP